MGSVIHSSPKFLLIISLDNSPDPMYKVIWTTLGSVLFLMAQTLMLTILANILNLYDQIYRENSIE